MAMPNSGPAPGNAPAAPAPAIDPESAQWAALEKELGVEPDAEPAEELATDAEIAPEISAENADKEPDKTPAKKLTYEELERNHKNIQAALREARARDKAAQDQLRSINELIGRLRETRAAPAPKPDPEPPKAPSKEEDPIGYFEHHLATLRQQLEGIQNGSQQSIEQVRAQQNETAFWNHVQASETAIRKERPDYDDACRHLETARRNQLAVMYPDESPAAQHHAAQYGMTPEQLREAMLNEDRKGVAWQAIQQGRSPAELYYEFAKVAGWQAPAPGAASSGRDGQGRFAKAAEQAIDSARRGQKAAKTLGASGGRSDNLISLTELEQLAIDDPEAFDKEWDRMARAGQLG